MLKITTLVENTSSSPEYRSKHGLSLYVETPKHKILFDLGPNGLFAENAAKLGIDIAKVDIVVISHGHKDHGGGLKKFLTMNQKAKIYIRKQAFDPHYIKVFGLPFRVGLDAKLQADNRVVFTDDIMVVDDELTLFSNVNVGESILSANKVLYKKEAGKLVQDDFLHEQNLLITIDGEMTLFSGCAHAGILNICKKAESLATEKIKHVIGGFHLYNPPTGKYESIEVIDSVSKGLAKGNCDYYTCHCTGQKAYAKMKETLGERLSYLRVGSEQIL